MNCPHCQAQIPADSKFCLECGQRLQPDAGNDTTDVSGINNLLAEAEQLFAAKQLSSCRQMIDTAKAGIMKLAAAGDLDSTASEVKRLDALEARLVRQEDRLHEFRRATEDALAEHDYPRCCELAEKATRLTTESTGCETAWQQAERFREELRARLVEARQAHKVQDWPHLQSYCRRILQLRPGHTEGKHLLQQAETALGKKRKLVTSLAIGIGFLLFGGLVSIVLLLQQGTTRRHEEAYREAIARGESLLEAKRYQQAADAFQAARLVPGYEDDTVAGQGIARARAGKLLAAAGDARQRGDWQTVAECGRQACDLMPDSAEARACRDQGRGQLLLIAARKQIAAKQYREALATIARVPAEIPPEEIQPVRSAAENGRQFEELIAAATRLMGEKQWQDAREKAIAAKALDVDSDQAQNLLNQATAGFHLEASEAAVRRGDWIEAATRLQAALAADPNSETARRLKQTIAPKAMAALLDQARKEIEARKYREALRILTTATELTPGYRPAVAATATCRKQLAAYEKELAAGRRARAGKHPDQAARHFRTAAKIYPHGEAAAELETLKADFDAVGAAIKKAETAMRHHDFATAGRILEEVLTQLAPGNARAGRLQAQIKQIVEKSDVLYKKAFAANEKGDPALALMLLEQLRKTNSRHAKGIALYRQIMGNRKAGESLRAAAAAALEQARAATGEQRQKQFEQAFESALKALQLLANDGETERLLREIMPAVAPPGMIAVTVPEFVMGADREYRQRTMKAIPDLGNWPPDETPAHRVKLRPFFIAKTEVTNAQYCEFLNAKTDENRQTVKKFKTGQLQQFNIRWRDGRFRTAASVADQPVVGIPWAGARAYCRWFGKRFGLVGDLPSEAQWEMAAAVAPSGNRKSVFAWGDDAEKARQLGREAIGRTLVASMPIDRSAFGVMDLAGNVAEWCRDYYSKDYYGDCLRQAVVRDPAGPETGAHRVVRGAAAGRGGIAPGLLRATARFHADPDEARMNIGFRVVLELPSSR